MKPSYFIEQLGGYKAVAREIRIPATTVAAWVARESIPSWREPVLFELALRRGKAALVAEYQETSA